MEWQAGVTYAVVGVAVVAAVWFWVVALLDWRRRDFGVTEERDKWMIRLIYGGCVGAVVYWIAGRKKGTLPGDGGTEAGEAESA